jgi:uncharacterized protein involved in type VI secretion and phage assembly
VSGVLDETTYAHTRHAPHGRWPGAYPAVVVNIADPDGEGRVQVSLPWSPDSSGASYLAWARLATMMGGSNRGTWFVPDVGDEVLVVFEAGDPRRPYVIGGLWNGSDTPPESMDSGGRNYKKVIRSRNGVKITFDDTDGTEQLIAETPGGQTVTLKDGPGSITVQDSNGNSIKLEAAGITITAAAKFTVNAADAEIAAASVAVNAGMTQFSGVAQTPTIIATSVIGTSYTPGAGNIW